MARRERVLAIFAQGRDLSTGSRILATTIAGIVAGVLLIATGIGLLQIVGALAVLLGLLAARCGARLPAAWWSDPRAQLPAVRATLRQVAPSWNWSAACVAVMVLAALLLMRRVLADGVNGDTLRDLAKGAVGLAMMATVLLWRSDSLASRWLQRIAHRIKPPKHDPLPDEPIS